MKPIRLVALVLALALVCVFWIAGFGFPASGMRGAAAVLVIPYLFLLVSHSPAEGVQAFRDAFRADHAATSVERLSTGAGALDVLGRYSLAVGVIGTMWAILAAVNEVGRLGATVTPQDMAPLLGDAFFLPALGILLRFLVYGPLAEALRSAWEVRAE